MRTWRRALGAALLLSLALVVPGDAAPATRNVPLVADGAWCWFQDARAVHHVGRHDKTYVGYVTSQGDVRVSSLDSRTGRRVITTLHPRLQRDDHASPGLLVLPDGRIAVFYSAHTGNAMYLRVSVRPEDISVFGKERVIASTPTSAGITYANPVYLPAEDRFYLFMRFGTARPAVMWSEDNLATWTKPLTYVVPTGTYSTVRPYVQYATNGWDTVLLAMTDGHPRNEPRNSVYVVTFRHGVFTTVGGAVLGSVRSQQDGLPPAPFRLSAVPKIYDGRSASGKAWVWSAAFDRDGHPVVAFSSFPTDRDHRYWYARFNGRGWVKNQFVRGGGSIDTTGAEPNYSGGIELDVNDPSQLYVSRPIGGQFEIERWRTADGGRTFGVHVQVTRGSRVKQVRPVVPWGPPGPVKVLWMAGRYDTYHDGGYLTAVRVLTSGPAPRA